MSRKTPSARRFGLPARAPGTVTCGALFVARLAIAAPSSTKSSFHAYAGHKCLVLAGSGDPAFVRNFNPYTATSLPSGGFVRGGMYEPLLVHTTSGGGAP